MIEEKKRIRPKFNKKIPPNAAEFLSPASDAEFRREHPIVYGILVIVGIIALMLPMVAYIILTCFIYRAPNSGWLMLGFAGAFIMGAGFFNIVAAWIKQYMGHLVTALSLCIGALMVTASCLLLYNKTLYHSMDQDMVNYYFFVLLFLLLPVIFYVMFRSSVNDWLRAQRLSRSHITKTKKGKRNFWWYEELHKTVHMGWIFIINKIFTILYPSTFVIHVLFGWIKPMTIPIFFAAVIIQGLASVMVLFSRIQYNLEFHKQVFVIIARSDNKGIDSIILDLLMVALPLSAAYTQYMMLHTLFV